MKHYIIVGDNNYWYGYFSANTKHQLEENIKEVVDNIKENDYGDEDLADADKLTVYEVKEIKSIDLVNDNQSFLKEFIEKADLPQ